MINGNEDLGTYGVNQLDAATDTADALSHLKELSDDPSLKAVTETDVYRLRRGLCLPSATAACINTIVGARLIGETHTDARITIGDLFRILIPFHNKRNLVDENGTVYPDPWFVVSESGDIYHQAMIAVAKGLGVQAKPILGISDMHSLVPFLQQGGTVAFSLDNSFVLNETLGRDERYVKEIDGAPHIWIAEEKGESFRKFEEGRHIVSFLGMNGDKFLIYDSFRLPQMDSEDTLLSLTADQVNPYLQYKQGGATRGIAFAQDVALLDTLAQYHNNKVFVPAEAIAAVKKMAGLLAFQ